MLDKVTLWKESTVIRVIIFPLPTFCMYTISLFAQRTKACEWYLMIIKKKKCLVSYSSMGPFSVLYHPIWNNHVCWRWSPTLPLTLTLTFSHISNRIKLVTPHFVDMRIKWYYNMGLKINQLRTVVDIGKWWMLWSGLCPLQWPIISGE